jgi:hypothetical protein
LVLVWELVSASVWELVLASVWELVSASASALVWQSELVSECELASGLV